MVALSSFLLKASLSMSLLYGVYWFFLRKQTLFHWNRIYLITTLVLSLILPLISIKYPVKLAEDVEESALMFFSPQAFENQVNIFEGILKLLPGIYVIGIVIFSIRIFWQFMILLGIILKNGSNEVEGVKLVYNKRYKMPFSFMNYIFINENNIRENEISDIIAHEKVHIREIHWFDLFVVELMSVFLWFNPFIWFYERSIKQNHEYLADEGVIAQGYNVNRYYSVLINQLMGIEVIGITNNLNYSLNSKRLKMMKKQKTPKVKALHTLWALPVIVLLLSAFAQPNYVNTVADIPAKKDKNVKLKVTLVDENGSAVEKASIIVKGKKTGTISDKKGMFTIKAGQSDVVIVKGKGYEESYIPIEKLVKQKGKKKEYTLTVKMKKDDQKEKGLARSDKEKELLMAKKKIEMEMKNLKKMKKKLVQAEKEGKISEEDLKKKQFHLQKEFKSLQDKKIKIEKSLKILNQ